MIKNFNELNEGIYFADYRYDEGVRIREEPISPTLFEDFRLRGEGLSKVIYLVEVSMKINNATKQGYSEVGIGDVKDIAYPQSKTRRGRVIDDGKTAPTLDTGCNIGYVEMDGKIIKVRRLTPRECFRLQGFPDEYFDRAAEVNSDTQLYKQAGNSVTVNVIYEFAKRFKFDDEVSE